MRNGLSRTNKVALGASVVLGSLGIGGTGLALLSGGSASAASTPTSAPAQPSTAEGKKLLQFVRRHTVHATVTVKTKNGYETIDIARGTVGAISSGSITVDSPDGTSLTATINAQTKFHNTTEQQLASGAKVGVISYDGDARVVNAPKAAPASS